MDFVNRKTTYRLYPNKTQSMKMDENRHLHCRVYNTLLEENQRHHKNDLGAFGFGEMCTTLTVWRRDVPALNELNAQSLQVTAKRVDLAFKAFFRRAKSGETPGYPRFKKPKRFKGWGYKTHGDGWRVHLGEEKHRHVRLSGIGSLRMRGKGRFQGTPKTAEVVYKHGKWYLSVTFKVEKSEVARTAPAEREVGSFDWGLEKLLTVATDGGIETIENPRWIKAKLEALKKLGKAASAEQSRLMAKAGMSPNEPIPRGTKMPTNAKLKRIHAQIRTIHGKIARQRHDFYHKLSAELVKRFELLGTEALDTKSMVARPRTIENKNGSFEPNGASRKTGLRRNIHDAAPAMLIEFIKYKAEEADALFELADTRTLKPSQRCHACDKVEKKALSERQHTCICGISCDRDENSALVIHRWLKDNFIWPGTGQLKPQHAV